MSSKPQCAPTEAWEAPIFALLHAKESKHPPKDGADRSAAADVDFLKILQNLPVAVYSTDAAGRIRFYNEAAASLWGRRPKLGEDWWCGSWRLFWPDGTPMGHDECPMAVTLKTGKAVRGSEAVAERPDGTRYPFIPYPTPLRNDDGQLVGAVNMLVDITERKRNEEAAQHYAAIVELSEDAILSKDINGVITSWNSGSQRLFGYTSQEAVGKPVTMLIPTDRHDEEPRILERIRRGERIDHYETVRQRKDGSFIDISLTVSPIRDLRGNIIGASKIARDITERKRAEERQDLLLREMDHRIKNLFALAIGIVSLSGRSARNVQDLVRSVRERLTALARAHALRCRTAPETMRRTQCQRRCILSFGRSSLLTRTLRILSASRLRSPDLTSGFPVRRSRVWRFCCTNSGQIPQNMERSPRQKGKSRSSARNTAKPLSSHGRSAADPPSPPLRTTKGSAPLSLARQSRANSTGKSPASGGPRDSSSGYPCRGSA